MHHTETTICQIIFILHVSVMSGSDGMLVVLQLGKTSERPLLNTVFQHLNAWNRWIFLKVQQ